MFLRVVEKDIDVDGLKSELPDQERHLSSMMDAVIGGMLHELSQRHGAFRAGLIHINGIAHKIFILECR